MNNNGFFIERSNDALAFSEIGIVPGSGTVSSESRYIFIAYTVRKGKLLRTATRRLRWTTDFSDQIIQSFADIGEIRILQNLIRGHFVIEWDWIQEILGFELWSINGRPFHQTREAKSKQTLS